MKKSLSKRKVNKIFEEYIDWDYDDEYGEFVNYDSIRKAIVASYLQGYRDGAKLIKK